MNRHHPLDEVFRDKLQDRAAEPPFHLWEQIDQKRTFQHRFFNQVRQKKPIALLLTLTALSGLSLLLWTIQQPVIRSFPILSPEASPNPRAQAKYPTEKNTPAAATPTAAAELSAASVSADANTDEGPSLPVPPASGRRGGAEQPSASAQPLAAAVLTQTEKAAEAIASNLQAAVAYSPAYEQVAPPSVRPRTEPELPPLPPESAQGLQLGPLHGLFSPEPKCAKFGNGNWNFYLDVVASPDLAFAELEAKSTEAEDYAKSRRESETRLFAFSGGVRLSMISDNGIALRTGINYSQINEKFTYFDGGHRREDYEPIRDATGAIIGYDTVITVGERYKVSQNQYHMLDIPFILGYEFKAGNLGISVNGGAYLNLLFRQEGDFLSPDNLEPVSFDHNDPNSYPAFRGQMGLGYYGSLGLMYETKAGITLLLEPHFKVFPKSITQEDYALDQRYMTAGLFFGLRKQL